MIDEAVDAVGGNEGFCLFDAADRTQSGEGPLARMKVRVTVSDFLIPNYENPWSVAVHWHDPLTGEVLHTETANSCLVAPNGSEEVLEWDGWMGDHYLRRGPYPYTVEVEQPILTHQPAIVAYQWQSGLLELAGRSASWAGSDSVSLQWTLQGSQEPQSAEVVVVPPNLVPQTPKPLTAALGTNNDTVTFDVSGLADVEKAGRWWFLIRAKDDGAALDRAGKTKLAPVKAAMCKTYSAENFQGAYIYSSDSDFPAADLESIAAGYQAGPFPDGSRYAPVLKHGHAGILTAATRWQEARVFYVCNHAMPGSIQFGYNNVPVQNFVGEYGGLSSLNVCLRTLRGDIQLAVFQGCDTGGWSPEGDLLTAAVQAGARSAMGFTTHIKGGVIGHFWADQFWHALKSVSRRHPGPCTVEEAARIAKGLLRARYYPARDHSRPEDYTPGLELYGYDNYRFAGPLGGSATLWPVQ